MTRLIQAGLLALAALLGVGAATSTSCVVGLALGTGSWCSWLTWFVGVVFAVPIALVIGLPLQIIFERWQFHKAWQYVVAGTLCAAPVWYFLAVPFSTRWEHAGGFDSLNYLGSGAFGGLCYWILSVKIQQRAIQPMSHDPAERTSK